MGRKVKKEAYVVFQGLKPGLYYTWPDCQKEVNGFSGAEFQGYTSRHEAKKAWNNFEQTSRRASEAGDCSTVPRNAPRLQSPIDSHCLTLAKLARPIEANELPRLNRNNERHNTCEFIVITSDDEEQPRRKKSEKGEDFFGDNADFTVFDDVEGELDFDGNESSFELTAAQEMVVEMAMNGDNIFLTGAAGSGKTATLKGILQRLRKKQFDESGRDYKTDPEDTGGNFPRVQVVAPTGIAALPLNGKTTYSFAGWNMNSFQQPLKELLRTVSQRVRKAIENLQVLIIEEISMVEGQFLERLNSLLQHVSQNHEPFGGKQVIFLGDFHQLPPVEPFEFCLHCGESMINRKVKPVCNSEECEHRGVVFIPGDKWAFRAPVWAELRLRHVKLDQIHRQKDARFQDVLNKIRNGVLLSDDEWNELTLRKEGDGAIAVRLMSRREQVKTFNTRQLSLIESEEKTWAALDTAYKLSYSEQDKVPPRMTQISRDLETHKKSLQDHRFPTMLALKIGAKVVLLSNLNPKNGLVNGSQGEVVKFVDTKDWTVSEPERKGTKRWLGEKAKIAEFQTDQGFLCPVVRFMNGKIVTIRPIVQESLRGSSYDRYIVSRTQIPITLAWALSIHKSQGMTLEHIEVSSNDIFESGQLYVGFSRATKLEGLTVTGYSRKQLSPDEDVLEFYEKTGWENLGSLND